MIFITLKVIGTMLKTKEKTKRPNPNWSKPIRKKPKNRPKCCTADMRKSFNVSVMANLPQSLFGSDPPSSLSSGAAVQARP
jgi:hypothetical protein